MKCMYRRASALEQLGWEKDALSMFAFSVAFAKRTEQGWNSIIFRLRRKTSPIIFFKLTIDMKGGAVRKDIPR